MADPLAPNLLAPLADLARWLDATGTSAVVVGGVAVSLLSRPRFTQDIDALAWLDERDWGNLLAAAADHGIAPRIEDPLGFASRARVLLMRHEASGIDIDLILGGLALEQQVVESARSVNIGGVAVRLPRVEHLLIMKAIAHRPRDQQDVAALLDTHPDADVELVRQWVREFAMATSMPDLIDDFDKLLARSKLRG